MTPLRSKIAAALGITLTVGLLVAQPADARRGGSFGSRGSRTYSAPARTTTSPGYVPPVQRSMTAPGSSYNGGYAPRPGSPGYAYGNAYGARPGMFSSGGFGRGMIGGLVAGGLIGGLLGHGFGGGWGGYGGGYGGAGLLGGLLQLLILFFVGSMIWRWFRNRKTAAGFTSPFAQGAGPTGAFDGYGRGGFNGGGFNGGGFNGGGYGDGAYGGSTAVPPTSAAGWQIPITSQDQADFETLLKTLQDAFGREDYGRLREITTPEVMSYLAEELSENATHGRRNEVTGTRLIKADVGEAWNEAGVDYATAAMRYESIDIMRDRATGAMLSGDPSTPSQTTELWTFVRHAGQPWKLTAIQETGT